MLSVFFNSVLFSKISLKRYSVFTFILFMLLATPYSIPVFQKNGNMFYLNYATVFMFSALIISLSKRSYDVVEKKLNIYEWIILAMLLLILLQPVIFYICDVKLYGHILDSYLSILSIYILAKKYGYLFTEDYILKVIAVFSICNSLFSFAQFITGSPLSPTSAYDSITYDIGYGGLKRVLGFVGSNNGAGNLGAILFTPLLYFLLKRPSVKRAIPFVFNIIFTILTFTRIGYASILIQVVIFLVYKNKNKIKAIKKTKLVVCVIFIIIFGYAIVNLNTTMRTLFEQRGSTQNSRWDQFTRAKEVIVENKLLGIGYGNYVRYAVNIFSYDDIIVHSQYINTLVESGIGGFAIFSLINIIPIIILIKKFKGNGWIPISLFVGNFIVINFNPNQYYLINIFIYFYVILNLVLCKKEVEEAIQYDEYIV